MLSRLIRRPHVQALVLGLQEAPDLQAPAARAALRDLRTYPALALEALLDAAARGRREELERITALLVDIYREDLGAAYVEALADPHPPVAMTVAKALAQLRLPQPQALVGLLDQPGTIKGAVFVALSGQAERLALPDLLRAAARLGGADRAALFALMRRICGPQDAPELLARLDARDADYRLGVVRLLEEVEAPGVAAALGRMLGDRDWRVRLAAIEALGQRGAEAAPEQLCDCLADPQFEVQARAIEMLSASRRPELPVLLAPLLGHESAAVRRAVVEVLNAVATVDSVRALLQAARDRDWWVRSRSADVLGRIGGARVLQAVRELLRDPDAFTRRTAVEIINAAGGSGSFEALAEAVHDPDWWVRERAIDGVAASGDGRSLALLREMLAQTVDEPTQLALIRGLSLQDPAAIIPDLAALLAAPSQNVRHAVLQALLRLRRADCDAVIARLVFGLAQDPDAEIRRLVAALLAGSGTTMDNAGPAPASGPASTGASTPPVPAMPPMPADGNAGADSPEATVALAAERPAAAAALSLEPGSLLGARYRVLRALGRGAFGSVLLVEDTTVHEQLAMKLLHPHLAGDEMITRRFVKELRLARRVTHPGIVRIHDLAQLAGSLAITMEYFPSHALAQELKAGAMMAPGRARSVALQLCAAMSAAHAADVLHRDLKPGNVLIDEAGIVKIADFGISAALSDEGTRLTGTGAVLGTPRYMSPEQVRGRPLDARSDIYSLGVMLYELFAGRTPYTGDGMSMMYQHLQGVSQPPSALRPELPPELDVVILRCLAVDAAERPASMGELMALLADALPG